jgi:hypothetical protein
MAYPSTTLTAITVGASPFTYTNPSAINQRMVAVYGGTVSAVTVLQEGINWNVGYQNGFVTLYPGQSTTVTYSVIPLMALVNGDVIVAGP